MPDPTYVFRAFLDPGADLLWAANDAARERWDYSVDHHELPISAGLAATIDDMLDRFAATIPVRGEHRPFTAEEAAAFRAWYASVLDRLRVELGPAYEIRDEVFGEPATT